MFIDIFQSLIISIMFIMIGHFVYEYYLMKRGSHKRKNVYNEVNQTYLKVSEDIAKDMAKEQMKNDLKDHIKTMI